MAAKRQKTKALTEFGDFQTPPQLAQAATGVLRRLGIRPRSVIEPTCGRGAFLIAAAACFPETQSLLGVDINAEHLREAEAATKRLGLRVELRQGDFFKLDWKSIVTKTGQPWLIIGNPPWVTSSDLGAIGSDNLPNKSNFHARQGIDAITGKSNFDISEWMFLRYLAWLEDGTGTIAALCKTAVARKTLLHIERQKLSLGAARLYQIDAAKYFGAAVDACFFVLEIEPDKHTNSCQIFESLEAEACSRTIGFLDERLVSNIAKFDRRRNLLGPEKHYVWRSGIKHDCANAMELSIQSDGYKNGLGETIALEDALLFPLLKSSDLGNGRIQPRSMMLVTQQVVGQSTDYIRTAAPKTWEYLKRHAALLGRRSSAIYKNKPAFSIFGVGPYTFAPWKVAISGFYKRLAFSSVGPIGGRPVVFDDTIYLLPCWSQEEACFIQELLNSTAAQEFYDSIIHWNDKRPITVEILKQLSLRKLAAVLGREQDYDRFLAAQPAGESNRFLSQFELPFG